ncbi:hypothetical protein [Spirosoma jeollabukense]
MSQLLFSPSVNIDRDANRALNYIPTDNTRRIVSQLLADYHNGVRAFTLIGSYGTGKSAFLWAFEQNINENKPYFRDKLFGAGPTEVVRFIGEYQSLANIMAERYGLEPGAGSSTILAALYYQHQESLKNGRLIILIDEFGKFLEHAAAHDPNSAVYFLQSLAEFAANPSHNILLITTVHQNFDAYAFGLSGPQRQEWNKVKGRFQEITFNEPIEQLLRLAATYLNVDKRDAYQEEAVLQTVLIFNDTRAFDLKPAYAEEVATSLFPLDLLAANVLTLCLQRYGQNERSLFSFLEASDHTSLKQFRRDRPAAFYHIGQVYDYLFFNFYSYLQSKFNPDYAAWSAIRNGLDEIERIFSEDIEAYRNLLKTIGLLNITAAQGSNLSETFLIRYAKTTLGIVNAADLIEALKKHKIILYRAHAKRFIPNNGTTLDVEAALIEVEQKIAKSDAVAALLQRYDDLPPVLAKAYTYEFGTPRQFKFVITDELRADYPIGEVDGLIYLIFNENLSAETVRVHSAAHSDQALIFVHYENTRDIIDLLYELQKLEQVKVDNTDDKIALRLLDENIEAARKTLNHFILGNLFIGSTHLTWLWQGERQAIHSQRLFNQLLSRVCQDIYPSAPIFKNELVNRHIISSSIFTARRQYFKALVTNWDKPDLGFEKSKFPPEKTIYLTLLKANGISTSFGSRNEQHPDPNRFQQLWKVSEQFLQSAKERRRAISGLYEKLAASPFKLKQGFLDFWIPTFLFLKRDDYALFGDKGYIPQLSDETLDLVIKYPSDYEVKTFDIEGVKLDLLNSYRTFLQQQDRLFVDNQTFVETIRPFLSFHRQLPAYAKNTQRLEKEVLALRTAIVTSVDPEKTFFEDFPSALGYSLNILLSSQESLSEYIHKIENAIRSIRHAYPELLTRFEGFIQEEVVGQPLPFSEYKAVLQKRFRKLSQPMLMPNQRVFVQRLNSSSADRDAWLSAMAQAVIGKSLDVISDEDEMVLYDKFQRMLLDLDSLTSLSATNIDPSLESVVGIELNAFGAGAQKAVIRLPKDKENIVKKDTDMLMKRLGSLKHDKQLNLAIVANLLNELLLS